MCQRVVASENRRRILSELPNCSCKFLTADWSSWRQKFSPLTTPSFFPWNAKLLTSRPFTQSKFFVFFAFFTIFLFFREKDDEKKKKQSIELKVKKIEPVSTAHFFAIFHFQKQLSMKRYFRCPAAVKILHLKKLMANKFESLTVADFSVSIISV